MCIYIYKSNYWDSKLEAGEAASPLVAFCRVYPKSIRLLKFAGKWQQQSPINFGKLPFWANGWASSQLECLHRANWWSSRTPSCWPPAVFSITGWYQLREWHIVLKHSQVFSGKIWWSKLENAPQIPYLSVLTHDLTWSSHWRWELSATFGAVRIPDPGSSGYLGLFGDGGWNPWVSKVFKYT